MAKRRKSPPPKKPFNFLWLLLLLPLSLLFIPILKKAPPTPAVDHSRGKELAKVYCSSCHIFPEPELLDKKSWRDGALPLMEFWLGLRKPNPEKRPDGEIVEVTDVYPSAPLLSTNDWEAIKAWYIATAPEKALPQQTHQPPKPQLRHFQTKPLAYTRATPMTTLLEIDEINKRLFVGDAMTRTLEVTDPNGHRTFALEFESSPISVRLRPDAIDLLLVGRLFPSDDPRGRLVQINPSSQQLTRVLANLRRPTDMKYADLNKDGKEDILVSQFGNLLGRLSWFENTDAGYLEHLIHELPGIIRAELHDFNNDGALDIIALAGQGRDGIYLFTNNGNGTFSERPLFQTHPLFGFTYMELADFNKDGHMDILAANGDNGEYDSPHKNYHGIRILLNDGQTNFKETYFYPMHGTYKAMSADFDQDGDLDIAAISYFPDYSRTPNESFIYLENTGSLQFTPSTTPDATRGRWFTMDIGDLDADGDKDIILGSFLLGPTTIPIPQTHTDTWKTSRKPLLLLDNTLRQ